MKKIGLFTLMATAIVGAVIAKNSTLLASSPIASEATEVNYTPALTNEGEQTIDSIADAIVSRADVDLKFTNDETYPWYISGDHVINGNRGKRGTISNLSFSFNSDKKTEITFDWLRNYYNWHTVQLYVDGVNKGSASNSSYQRERFYLSEGQHVILFRDTISSSSSHYDYDYSFYLPIN